MAVKRRPHKTAKQASLLRLLGEATSIEKSQLARSEQDLPNNPEHDSMPTTNLPSSSVPAVVPVLVKDPDNYIDRIRALPAIQAVLQELQKQETILRVDKSVVNELKQYCATKSLIPAILSADNRETVESAQQGLQELQARLDRVAAVHLEVRKIQRALQRLETMARHDLAVHLFITTKTSKPSADQLVALVLPELQIHQDAWETFSRICRDVQDHLGSAKDVIRIQMKLDENLHWAQRSGA